MFLLALQSQRVNGIQGKASQLMFSADCIALSISFTARICNLMFVEILHVLVASYSTVYSSGNEIYIRSFWCGTVIIWSKPVAHGSNMSAVCERDKLIKKSTAIIILPAQSQR